MSAGIEVLQTELVSKGKYRVSFSNRMTLLLYYGEMKSYSLQEGTVISEEHFHSLLEEAVGKRAKKRAMYLLEQMDRTEEQLRSKLQMNEYPLECIDEAIEYVKHFHYLDDYRYACNYVRYHGQALSKGQLTQKLMQKGVPKDMIKTAIEEEYLGDEMEQIKALLNKKNFDEKQNDQKEKQKIYQFLLRRGFKSNDILKAMKS